ncbi:LANO_0B03642g1_1 [Lachancea nothofagi CBS 11611]|uniref:LANO_0B03642g1_1 n=1 Tax=Lachancea nothofagi CBS 11611 TaxID=1266666 RepID=A0A1G4IX19_9SACH|nr:LANO_0B03642g1_1 [Lachancea nothofagi CBS 11611]
MVCAQLKKVRFCLEQEDSDICDDERALPLMSKADLATHSTKEDCWIAIHGKVYNVSGYLSKHPGGSQVILKLAGRDATVQFDDVGHSLESLMFDLGPQACVGVLKPPVAKLKPARNSGSGENTDNKAKKAPETFENEKGANGDKSRWEQLWKWEKPQSVNVNTTSNNTALSDPFHNLKSSVAAFRLRSGQLIDSKADVEVHRLFNTVVIAVVMGICVVILIYVKLRCPSMIEHVVSHAFPEESSSRNYEIPTWSL